ECAWALAAEGKSPARRRGRVPSRHYSVVLGDLVFDPDVEVGPRAAPAGHEPAHALRAQHAPLDARQAADVIGRPELVDEFPPLFIPARLDAQSSLELVELDHAVHDPMVMRTRPRSQGRLPEGFPPDFRWSSPRGRSCMVPSWPATGTGLCASVSASSRRFVKYSSAHPPERER